MSKDDIIGEVNLDNSSIEINSEWMTQKELKSAIKSRIDSGDYDVTLYADALKKLEKALKTLEDVQLRMPINVLNAYKDLAKDTSSSIESCLRKGVTEYLRYHDKLKPLDDVWEVETGPSGKKSKNKRRSK